MKRFTLTAIAVATMAMGASTDALAKASIGAQLAETLPSMSGDETVMAVVTFEQMSPVAPEQVRALKALGITKGVQFSRVPVIGVVANAAQINAIAERDDVRSVWLNRKLEYFNANSRDITGVNKLQGEDFINRNGVEYTGKGVTIMVNDSGIDATHQDLFFGDTVVDNVQAVTHSLDLLETGITDGFVIKGQPNTDLNVGHGTHCAGTIAGSGVMSGGKYKGVAPDADLVGYGSGAGLFILDAVGGYDYAIQNVWSYDNPLRIMSNSWGSSGKFEPDGAVELASYLAYKNGILSIFAAGNSGKGENSHNPYAQIPWGMSVGAGDVNGNLVEFSSRGLEPESGEFSMPDGTSWTYNNEVSIVGPGRFVISTRSSSNMVAHGGRDDIAIEEEYLPFYTNISGTSMSTPHVAGVAALMMEANPDLSIDEIKQLMMESATNMPGYERWEVGAGYVNAYAAVAAAKGNDMDHKRSVNNLPSQPFFASVHMEAKNYTEARIAFNMDEAQTVEFEVTDPNARVVNVGVTALSSVWVVLTDPDGNTFEGRSTEPVWDGNSYASAPAKLGTWRLTMKAGVNMRLLGEDVAVEADAGGVVYDEQAQTEYASDNHLTYWVWQDVYTGSEGMDDVAGHPVQGAIENAVTERLMDGRPSGAFDPDAELTREELAKALVMGASVRQHRSLDNEADPHIHGVSDEYRVFAESVVMPGAALKDAKQQFGPVMLADNGDFRGQEAVTKLELAYSLAQVIGKSQVAKEFGQDHVITVTYNGETIEVADQEQIPAALRGFVQVALDEKLLSVRYSVEQGEFDLVPKLVARFMPNDSITRAQYALIANKLDAVYFIDGTRANAAYWKPYII